MQMKIFRTKFLTKKSEKYANAIVLNRERCYVLCVENGLYIFFSFCKNRPWRKTNSSKQLYNIMSTTEFIT